MLNPFKNKTKNFWSAVGRWTDTLFSSLEGFSTWMPEFSATDIHVMN
jgi:hypothetical protein